MSAPTRPTSEATAWKRPTRRPREPSARSPGALAHEGGPHGIRVNYLSMGVVKGTKFALDNPQMCSGPDVTGPLGDLPDVADIAEAAAFLLSDRARFITGEIVNVSGGAYMRP